MNLRTGSAVFLPVLALAVQWMLWPWIAPFVWFLFFPAVFFSARLGGLWSGLASAALSAVLVWYFFIPPQLSWQVANPYNLYSLVLFLLMGYLFSDSQERLRQAQRATEGALAEARKANDRITELYRQTLELDELKSQFFANVSHELRTPLTLIMSPLQRRLAMNLPQAEKLECEMMLRNARVLYRHVSDLLDAAKLESKRMPIRYASIDIAALVRTTTTQFDSLAQEKGITCELELPASLQGEIDSEKLQRILVNLLSNAYKFTPGGGRIVVRLREAAGDALIEVEDSGPGVPGGMREAVFERFRQLEGGSRRRFGGTGLGLAIVKDFVQLHRGNVRLTEASSGGALFIVVLPLRAPAGVPVDSVASQLDPVIDRQALDELQPSPPAGANGLAAAAPDAPLVLVVEDNADMNAFIAASLTPAYRTASACDGREGLARALALRPDLILCDVMMPHMDGEQMVAELRRQPGMESIPVVMLTAKADEELRLRLLKDGVQDYLAKPFAVDELLARVGGLVATRRRTLEELQASEAEIRRLNASLERRVTERTAELSAANQELEAFAYAVSHDLRAPLRAMGGFSQALLEDFGGKFEGEAKIYLDQIGIASRKMGELIDGILALSRSTRGALQRDRVDLSALATRLLQELAQAEPGRSVAWQVAPGLSAVGDARMLEAVLRNLIENAWKYTARTETAEIRVCAGSVDGLSGTCVVDNGAGFDMNHSDRLFKPFQRLHRQDEFAGTGIGLATVQRIIHRHGGFIRAQGRPGAGASFCFGLPACTAEESNS